MFRPLIFAAALLLFAFPVQAGGLEEVFSQAQQAYKDGKNEEAAALFIRTADMLTEAGQQDKAPQILSNAAICHIRAENWEAAVDVLNRILSFPAKNIPEQILVRTYNNLNISLARLNRPAMQIEASEKMLKALPKLGKVDVADVQTRIADAYRRLELYAKANEYYSKALKLVTADLDPVLFARICTGKALSLGNLGEFDQAVQSLNSSLKALEKSKDAYPLAQANSNLGILHWERGDYPEALKLLETALHWERGDTPETGKRHAELKLSDQDKTDLRRSEGVDSNNIGLVYKSMGRMPDAMVRFEEAIAIAREVKDRLDEAKALSNRALLNRIAGNLDEARADYKQAMAIYEEKGFQEGRAGALMGIAKMAELEERNYAAALDGYKQALEIYTRLEMPRGRAEALLQIGGILKKSLTPGRASRDLVYEDDPVEPAVSGSDALTECANVYAEALRLAERCGSKEMIWPARQGAGFVLRRQDKLEEALDQYMKAIDMVTAMRVSLADVELLGEYMAGKEDLYEESMELCARLFEKTRDAKYLSLQMRLGETLRNEVQKASASLVRLNFADSKKQALYDDLTRLGKRQAQAEAAVPLLPDAAPDQKDAEASARYAMQKEAAEKQKSEVAKLDKNYQKLLEEWKKKYPGDAVVFESSSRVDIPSVQKVLGPDQVVLQYVALRDQMLILAVSADKVDCATVPVSQKEMTETIKTDFLVKYIEEYGHMSAPTLAEEERHLKDSLVILSRLHKWLVEPVQAALTSKKRIYVVADGFLAQVPFGALVTKMEGDTPSFLVEEFDIAYVRPSFITALTKPKAKESIKTLLAVGNPRNTKLTLLAPLDGAEKEVSEADATIKRDTSLKDVKFQRDASEGWLKNNLAKSKYEFIYFATHGMPHSETYYKFVLKMGKSLETMKKKQESDPTDKRAARIAQLENERNFILQQIPGLSPLNGFLYMSESGNEEDGLLTIKEIMEIPESSFSSTRYALLSACNTGVTFAPATLEDGVMEEQFSIGDVEKELRKTGWVPGIDQVSFVDVFMRRGINNVYGTLWFASDESSQYLMSNFMKRLMEQGNAQDAVIAFSDTQRQYIADCKAGQKPLGSTYPVPLNPYFWAVGAMFGK